VKEPVVSDSTCLIGLERIDRLALLPDLFDPILIPPAVDHEFGRTLSWLQIKRPSNSALTVSLELIVDAGEAEAIALAYETEVLLVLDDRPARAVARHLGIRIVGTIGILLRAKHFGLIDALDPLLRQLKATGFYVADELITKALKLARE
jgi:predicted nucleic acid-binding protein